MNHVQEYYKSKIAKKERPFIPLDQFYKSLKQDEWLQAGIDRGDGEKLVDGHMWTLREAEEKKMKELNEQHE